jgi:hypothetical protein
VAARLRGRQREVDKPLPPNTVLLFDKSRNLLMRMEPDRAYW